MSNILACYQLLELNVISAQDLAPVVRSMRTYAVAWIDPDRKLSTRVDSHGGTNPAWNDKFVFRVDEEFIYNEESVITIDIYAIHWFRDIHVGTAHVLTDDLIPPPQHLRNTHKPAGIRFVGLQVLRPSGRPKGILNVGVTIIDSSMRSMPLYTRNNTPAVGYSHDDHPNDEPHPELRRTKSDTSSMPGSEVMGHEHRGKAKKGKKPISQVSNSEVSSKSKKKSRSMLSGSDVKATTKKGKFDRKNKKVTVHVDSPSNFNTKMNVGHEVKPSPRRDFQNSPAHHEVMPSQRRDFQNFPAHHDVMPSPRRDFQNSPSHHEVMPSPRREFQNSPAHHDVKPSPRRDFQTHHEVMPSPRREFQNSPAPAARTYKGVRAAPLHAFAMTNAALEYGTPYRSNLGHRPMMTNSELGPSASEVAAAVARQPVMEEEDSSEVGGWSLDDSVEGLQPKVERWQTELPTVYDGSEISSRTKSSKKGKHLRRHTEGGGNGLFSCFGVICGVECSIVCGGNGKKNRGRRRAQSADNESFL